MHLDLRLNDLPMPRIAGIGLAKAIQSLQEITSRNHDRDNGTAPEPPQFKNLKEQMKQRLMIRGEAVTFEAATEGAQRERLLLSLYLEYADRSDASWLPAFDESVASSVLGKNGRDWSGGKRSQVTLLFFKHFEHLPALEQICCRLREAYDKLFTHTSEQIMIWRHERSTIFASDGPQKIAIAALKGGTLMDLMDRFAIPKEGRSFSARLKECYLLTRLDNVELGQGQEILQELESIRTLRYEAGVPLGAAALRIMTRRVFASGGKWKGDWTDWILRLGCDPALPPTSEPFGKWWGCWHPTRAELECAQRGVSRMTLEYFIRFLEASLSGTSGYDQFEARAGFLRWLDDTKKINRFKLLLHPRAFSVLPLAYQQQRQRVARIEGSGQGASIIVMECTDEMWIVEGTHGFAVRAFRTPFPVPVVFREARTDYDYTSFTQGPMHRHTCAGIWKAHIGEWRADLLQQMSGRFHVEWPDQIMPQNRRTPQAGRRPQTGRKPHGGMTPQAVMVSNATVPVIEVVAKYIEQLGSFLERCGRTSTLGSRTNLLEKLVATGKIKSAWLGANDEGRYFLFLLCCDDIMLADATFYGNLSGSRGQSAFWQTLVKTEPGLSANMQVSHSPAEGYARRFYDELLAKCGVSWLDLIS